jgi:CheY-like chemotaxis protein
MTKREVTDRMDPEHIPSTGQLTLDLSAGELAEARRRVREAWSRLATEKARVERTLEPDPRARANGGGRRRTILFADDVPVTRFLLARFLARVLGDVDVIEARDGAEAFAMFDAHAPDLVVLDLRMPELDGWQAARRIRDLPNGRDVPILAISVNASSDAHRLAVQAGCDEFVAKPITDYTPLQRRIEYWLEHGRSAGLVGALSA